MTPNSSTGTAPALAAGQELTPSELEQGRLFLQQTRDYIIGATKGLSEEQWNFKPAPGRWSIAENVNHAIVVQELVLGPIREQLATAPAPSADFDYKQVDGIVLNQVSSRLSKFPAPEVVRPAGQCAPAVACGLLSKNYERLADYYSSRLRICVDMYGNRLRLKPFQTEFSSPWTATNGC